MYAGMEMLLTAEEYRKIGAVSQVLMVASCLNKAFPIMVTFFAPCCLCQSLARPRGLSKRDTRALKGENKIGGYILQGRNDWVA